MILKSHTFKVAVPVFIAGAAMMAFSSRSLEEKGAFVYEPNPGALAKSPFGRTVGMALQGPINRFWGRGISPTESRTELLDGNRPDEKLFNLVTRLREDKLDAVPPKELRETYKDYSFERIERKLELAWKMDPRNYGNYAIYQMFLWEGFNHKIFEPQYEVQELSLATLETCLQDEGNPVSLLTAGQAAYDLVFDARTSDKQTQEEAIQNIGIYSQVLPSILDDFDSLVAEMKENGRWNNFSEVKKAEFQDRRNYLETLNRETQGVVERLTSVSPNLVKGGTQS